MFKWILGFWASIQMIFLKPTVETLHSEQLWWAQPGFQSLFCPRGPRPLWRAVTMALPGRKPRGPEPGSQDPQPTLPVEVWPPHPEAK